MCWVTQQNAQVTQTQDETLRAGVRLFSHSLTAYGFMFVSYSVLTRETGNSFSNVLIYNKYSFYILLIFM